MKPLGIIASLGLFTTLPVPPTPHIDRSVAGRAIAWFPFTGALIGACAGLAAAGPFALDQPLLGSALGAATVAWVTGGLHLDGVADTADGLGSRKSPEEGLRIMKQSDIGPMGVATMLLVVLLGVASVTTIASALPWWATALTFVAAGAVARVPVLFATTPGHPNARPGGFGALFHGVTKPTTAGAVTLIVAAGVGGLGLAAAGIPGLAGWLGATVAALFVGWAWQRRLQRHFGGMTGDLFGSIIEVTATAFLITAALASSLVGA